MQIEVLRSLGRGLPSFSEGQVVEVDNETGEALCSKGLAVAVIQAVPPEPIKGIPPKQSKPKATSSDE